MVDNPPKDTPYVSPYLLVDDVDEQVDWVVDVLGFADQGRGKVPTARRCTPPCGRVKAS